MKELEKCTLCPFECKVNRNQNILGKCKAGNKIKLDLYKLHYDEEPPISGSKGSGTVFFSNCNLKCKFCQNYKISCEGKGKEIEIEELSKIFLELQNQGANNINLVTAVPYVPQIIESLKLAKANGLTIPILYNTSGYESLETLKKLEGYIDIYLPDLKYSENSLAKRLSNTPNYFEIATKAIQEMQKQVGQNQYDENGIMKKGIIIRHLVLPNNIENSKGVLKWIKQNMPQETMVSLMAQYFPTYKALEDEEINRKLAKEEYREIEKYLYELNIENGFLQDLEDEEEKYVPEF